MSKLVFAVCPLCAEKHALWRGVMSIHTTAAGERCAPNVIPRHRPAPTPVPETPLTGEAKKRWLKSLTQMERTLYDLKKVDAAKRELSAKNRSSPLYGLHRKTEPLDRRIYQVNGARPVSGGLPSLGKRAR